MAKVGKVLLVLALAAALMAVAFAAEAGIEDNASVLSAPRRMLKAVNWRNWYGYGYGGGFGWWPYQENRWVSAARMDTSVERRFAMASKK